MNNKNLKSKKISLCGVFGALSLTIMLFGSILPFSSYLSPALSGLLLIPIANEYNKRTAFIMFFAICLLSFFIVPDKEAAFLFIAFLGWYPILKASFDKIRFKFLRYILKFVIFNASVAIMYYFIIFLFPIDAVVASFNGLQYYFIVILIVMANITFFIYDISIIRLTYIYKNIFSKFIIR